MSRIYRMADQECEASTRDLIAARKRAFAAVARLEAVEEAEIALQYAIKLARKVGYEISDVVDVAEEEARRADRRAEANARRRAIRARRLTAAEIDLIHDHDILGAIKSMRPRVGSLVEARDIVVNYACNVVGYHAFSCTCPAGKAERAAAHQRHVDAMRATVDNSRPVHDSRPLIGVQS